MFLQDTFYALAIFVMVLFSVLILAAITLLVYFFSLLRKAQSKISRTAEQVVSKVDTSAETITNILVTGSILKKIKDFFNR